jgi:hypothetical protein
MPTSSEAYSAVPVNRNARQRLMRAARLGTRPVRETPNIGDAVRAVSAVAAVADGWSSSSAPFPSAMKEAWAARTER